MKNFLDSLVAISALQSLVFGIIILLKKRKTAANYTFSVLFLSFSFYIFTQYVKHTNNGDFAFLVPWDYSAAFLFAPLIYIYISLQTSHIKKFRPATLLHFVPFFLSIAFIGYFFGSVPISQRLEIEAQPTSLDIIDNLHDIYAGIYLFPAFVILHRYKKSITSYFSDIEKLKLSWLFKFIYGVMIIFIFVITLNIIAFFNLIAPDFSIYEHIALALFTFILGYFGFLQPDIHNETTKMFQPGSEKKKLEVHSSKKYQRNRLDDNERNQFKEELLEFIEKNKPYLDSSLTLQDLAEKINITHYHLSQLINDSLGKNFYNFINELRVEHVKHELKKPKNAERRVLDIALESGFNSKSSFNTMFKKVTGTTPTEYKKMILN